MLFRQQGFNLTELLLVSLVGTLILVATLQLYSSLARHKTYEAAWLRLQERARLAELVLSRDLAKTFEVVEYQAASRSYPDFSSSSQAVTQKQLAHASFSQYRSSDWMLISQQTGDNDLRFSLWHLDEKTYGRGLAHKASRPSKLKQLSSSQTVIQHAELLRFRLLCAESSSWQALNNPCTHLQQVRGIQFAVILASEAKLPEYQQSALYLWGEQLNPPNDGRLRTLASGRVLLKQGAKND